MIGLTQSAMGLTCSLAERVECLDVHGHAQTRAHHAAVSPELVARPDLVVLPVRPVECVLEQGESEGVRQICGGGEKVSLIHRLLTLT